MKLIGPAAGTTRSHENLPQAGASQLTTVRLNQIDAHRTLNAIQLRKPLRETSRDIRPHLITALPDPGPNRRFQITGLRTELRTHPRHSLRHNRSRRSPPTRMDSPYGAPHRIDDQNRNTISRPNRDINAWAIGNQGISIAKAPKPILHLHDRVRMHLFQSSDRIAQPIRVTSPETMVQPGILPPKTNLIQLPRILAKHITHPIGFHACRIFLQ